MTSRVIITQQYTERSPSSSTILTLHRQRLLKFDMGINLSGAMTVEPRMIGNGHTVVFHFNNTINALTGVTRTNGAVNPQSVSMGFLVGDFNSTRSVNASDISSARARSGQTSNVTNFKFDVNISGGISSTDVSAVKARTGLVLP